MQVEIRHKQPNSKMCFVCGMENRFGLKSRFYELENDELLAIFSPDRQHQGYPGRLHGGIAAAVLDETIGRAIMIKYSENIWGVTIDFSMRFKRPIPLDGEIRVLARITKDTRKIFEGSGEILLSDGTTAITATGKYLKMDISTITDADFEGEDWGIVEDGRDPDKVVL